MGHRRQAGAQLSAVGITGEPAVKLSDGFSELFGVRVPSLWDPAAVARASTLTAMTASRSTRVRVSSCEGFGATVVRTHRRGPRSER
jgi:hypothetical protein